MAHHPGQQKEAWLLTNNQDRNLLYEVYSLTPPGLWGIHPPGLWGIDPHRLGGWGRGGE